MLAEPLPEVENGASTSMASGALPLASSRRASSSRPPSSWICGKTERTAAGEHRHAGERGHALELHHGILGVDRRERADRRARRAHGRFWKNSAMRPATTATTMTGSTTLSKLRLRDLVLQIGVTRLLDQATWLRGEAVDEVLADVAGPQHARAVRGRAARCVPGTSDWRSILTRPGSQPTSRR